MTPERVVGGLGPIRGKDEEVVEVVNKVIPILSEKTGKKFKEIEVISYKKQVVAGINFFVKALAKTVDNQENIVHLRIYRDLQQKVELSAHQLDKKKEDEILYFQ